jgi:hypothetical protein
MPMARARVALIEVCILLVKEEKVVKKRRSSGK